MEKPLFPVSLYMLLEVQGCCSITVMAKAAVDCGSCMQVSA
jgi:hypothetical protein